MTWKVYVGVLKNKIFSVADLAALHVPIQVLTTPVSCSRTHCCQDDPEPLQCRIGSKETFREAVLATSAGPEVMDLFVEMMEMIILSMSLMLRVSSFQ